ncbi:hypothetical protein SAMN06265218_11315 [Fodinibius sediminis]|uniref:Uncharacterized protein n=1 Tax=Fodinibius sediminis TaxID=1214077 RepID=A0A521E5D7_9BACT|nr:hypothetical protein SAMN06265218_11315 [Fodinibius sediminis]
MGMILLSFYSVSHAPVTDDKAVRTILNWEL